MLARLLGREAPPPKPAKEETPEEEEESTKVTSKYSKSSAQDLGNNNNEQEQEQAQQPITSVKVGEIELDFSSSPQQQSAPSPSTWIYSYDKKVIWPQDLQQAIPQKLALDIESRKVPGRDLDDKIQGAQARRDSILRKRSDTLAQHNSEVEHTMLLNRDSESNAEALRQQQHDKLDAKLHEAQLRREDVMGERRLYATYSSLSKISESEFSDYSDEYADPQELRQKRMERAVLYRSLVLKEIRRRAAHNVDRARTIASEVASTEAEAAEEVDRLLQQRLQHAEVRRSIVLDRKRLSAGRHGNYVKSVYLTNQYIKRRSAQMIQHNLEAAAFRREVKLEEIKSNARQQNLSAQFRACCAYRMLDAKWLNYALKSTAAQTTAKIRRDSQLEALQERLHQAEVRRADVLATHKLIVASRSDLEQYDERQRLAEQRREMYLYERVMYIRERNSIIKSRKARINAFTRSEARKAIELKLNDARHRRAAFLERRRSALATRNWHAKVLCHRQEERFYEERDIGRADIQGKLDAASKRREYFLRPVFAELTLLRVANAHEIRLTREAVKRETANRQSAFKRIRIQTLRQEKMNKAYERLSQFNRVQSNREFMDNFYKQVISNTTMARQRGAELRRSMYNDAVKAAATETILRSEDARERLRCREETAREYIELKQNNAEARRIEATSERVSSALWFLGKVAVGSKRLRQRAELQNIATNEALSNAELRRSIILTRSVQANAKRAQRFSNQRERLSEFNGQLSEANEERMSRSEALRDAELLRKKEVARNASNRVTVARLEKRAEDVVDAAIRTAIQKTMSRNAEARRQCHLEDIQNQAAHQVSYARGVAKHMKELDQIRADITLQQSRLRVMQTSKRRDKLMTQRKLGQSTIDHLQPYAGLQVIGKSIPVTHTA